MYLNSRLLSFFLSGPYVKFTCSLFEESYSFDEIKCRIEDFLFSELASEPVMASALILQTLNRSEEKTEQCVNIIGKLAEGVWL